jgi:hypothetical protein
MTGSADPVDWSTIAGRVNCEQNFQKDKSQLCQYNSVLSSREVSFPVPWGQMAGQEWGDFRVRFHVLYLAFHIQYTFSYIPLFTFLHIILHSPPLICLAFYCFTLQFLTLLLPSSALQCKRPRKTYLNSLKSSSRISVFFLHSSTLLTFKTCSTFIHIKLHNPALLDNHLLNFIFL